MLCYKILLDTIGHGYGMIVAQVCSCGVDNGFISKLKTIMICVCHDLSVGHIIFTYYMDLRVRLLLEIFRMNYFLIIGFSGQESKLFMTYT